MPVPLPSDFYQQDRNYRIRLCMLVSEAISVVPGSKIDVCDSCDEPIWVSGTQDMPDLPDGMELHGDVSVCKNCARTIHQTAHENEVDWLGPPPPPSIEEAVRKFFGLT
jgi:hypothetical protein